MGYRYVDKCSDCGQGLVLVMKDKLANRLVLVCDDCESMWKDPALFYLNEGRISCDSDVQLSEEVSVDDIVLAGWDKYIKNMDNPIDL